MRKRNLKKSSLHCASAFFKHQNMMIQSTSCSWKNDFPYDMHQVPFAQNSIESTLKNKKEQFYKNINLIVGGRIAYPNGVRGFHEILLSDKDNSISFKSFANDYKTHNANLGKIGICATRGVQSFLLDNNKYLIVFREHYGYNVYDMINDKWLLNTNNTKFLGQKCILITDQIIASYDYYRDKIHLYYIGANNMTNPQHIKAFTLDTNYSFAGMCCTEFIKNEKDNKLMFKILLCGSNNIPFLSSFLSLSISLSLNNNKIIKFDQNKIDEKMFKFKNVSLTKNEYYNYNYMWIGASCECIFNEKNEAIVVFIGGMLHSSRNSRSICLYNPVSHEMYFYHKVMCVVYSIKMNLFIMLQYTYFLFSYLYVYSFYLLIVITCLQQYHVEIN